MLDNFEPEKLKRDAATFKAQFPHVLIEASGGITTETMPDYLSEHVDIVSQGKLTQGYPCLDYSLKIVH
jgi:nicotinate-nucleotide pyrophosphorylase (carboxylating)